MAVIGCRAWNTLCSPINPPVLFAACQASADSTHSRCRCGRDAPPPASSPHHDCTPFAQRSGRVAPVREWAAGADLRSHTLQQEFGAQLLPVLIAYTRVLSRGAVSTSVSARLRVGKMGGVVWGVGTGACSEGRAEASHPRRAQCARKLLELVHVRRCVPTILLVPTSGGIDRKRSTLARLGETVNVSCTRNEKLHMQWKASGRQRQWVR